MDMQTELRPGDLVFVHPQNNPGHIKKQPKHIIYNLLPLLVVERLSPEMLHSIQPWYRLLKTSRVSGQTSFVKLPESMLTKFEELYE